MPGKLVTMTKAELIKEHKRLVKILVSGTPSQRRSEAERQRKELEGYR